MNAEINGILTTKDKNRSKSVQSVFLRDSCFMSSIASLAIAGYKLYLEPECTGGRLLRQNKIVVSAPDRHRDGIQLQTSESIKRLPMPR